MLRITGYGQAATGILTSERTMHGHSPQMPRSSSCRTKYPGSSSTSSEFVRQGGKEKAVSHSPTAATASTSEAATPTTMESA